VKEEVMRYLKMFGLAAVAAAALAAFIGAGSAAATVLCSTTVEPCPPGQTWSTNTVFDFSVPFGAKLVLTETNGEEVEACETSTMKGKITNAGSTTGTVTGPVEETNFGSCTFPTGVLKRGNLEIHKISATSNGTVTVDGTFEWTINTIFFGSCIFGFTSGTSIGDVTEGNPAILHINAVVEKFSGSNLACPSTELMRGTYTLTSPASTTLSVSGS
jgi:hypothetical protein